MQPKNNPTYYTDLINELEQAPQRSFWARMTNRWKGALRFQ
jgi:cytochrome b pre-mRNA-processing protein 6